MRQPLVSVVTATRNRPDRLRQALESVRMQSLEEFEAIVIDDGSTADVLAEYDRMWPSFDSRFQLVRASPPGCPGSGPGVSRNRGLEIARGEFVAFLDHDDFYLQPSHLSVGVAALMEANADYFVSGRQSGSGDAAALSWARRDAVFEQGRRLDNQPSVHVVPLELFLSVMQGRAVHPSQAIVRRSLLAAVGGFASEIRAAFDVNLMLRLVDRTDKILYRSEITVEISMPDTESYTAAIGPLAQRLGTYQALFHARLHCTRRDVSSSVRSRQARMLRQFAKDRLSIGHRWGAVGFMCEAISVYPTAGAIRDALVAIGSALRG